MHTEPRCPSIDEWMKKQIYKCTTYVQSTEMDNEIMRFQIDTNKR